MYEKNGKHELASLSAKEKYDEGAKLYTKPSSLRRPSNVLIDKAN